MQVSQLAEKLNTSPDTVRRWTREYAEHLSPSATISQRGGSQNNPRVYNAHDAAVLQFVSEMRTAGRGHDEISAKLAEHRQADYRTLPGVPSDWFSPVQAIPVDEVTELATRTAGQIVLQAEYERAVVDLEKAQARIAALEAELAAAREVQAKDNATQGQYQDRVHVLEVELERAKAEVAAIKAVYGGRSPLTVTAAALILGVLLVIVILVLAKVLV